MAKKAKSLHTKKGLELKIVNPNAAGIDIADTEMQVCVPSDRDGENNRRFGSFTRDLEEISGWLKACGVDTVAMEATGVYWIPLFFRLQEDGFDVILCNARDVKNISEKKTDEADAEWLMLLHSYGLLKPSFQPENEARQVRNLCRHRNALLRSAAREVQHMQKAMEQMNVKLTNVLSDIVGVSGKRIIGAILDDGERDPAALAEMADGRCKRSKEEIALSLEGTWDEDHLFVLRQSRDLYEFYQGMIAQCDAEIEALMKRFPTVVDADLAKFVRSGKKPAKKNAVGFDVEKYAFGVWGVNMMAIPGMSAGSMLQLIGELGSDFTRKFDTPDKFCKWCNLVPNNKISGGKLISSRIPKRKNPTGQIFRLCANTVAKSKDPLGCFFRRIKSKSGHMQAIVATAHKLATIFFVMARDKVEFDQSKVGASEEEILKKKLARLKRELLSVNAELSKSAS